MASVNSISFDQASYDVGAVITAAVNYTPDTATTTVPHTFTLTATVHDAAGNAVASNSGPFVVNVPQQGDTLAVSDDGNHSWTVGAPAAQADGSFTSDCTAVA